MRISRKRRPERIELNYKVNEEIQAPQLRVVDEEGRFLGIMSREEALKMSHEKTLDLVEIAPKGDTPVAKLIEYGKFRYQKEKEIKKMKGQQTKVDVKGIRLSLRIGEHDMALRIKQAAEFLQDGDKVKIELILRGREKGKGEIGRDIMMDFMKRVEQTVPVKVEQPIARQFNGFMMIITKR
jgi:translation initiation factor IF-3